MENERVTAKESERYCTKKRGKTEVDPFWELSDIKNMLDYFELKGMWHWWLTFVLGLTMGRRVSDTLSFKISDFFEENGNMKYDLIIIERKTGKETRLRIGEFVKESIKKYIEKTGIDIAKENYLFPHPKKTLFDNNSDEEIYNSEMNKAYSCEQDHFDSVYSDWCELIDKNYIKKQSDTLYKLYINRNERAKSNSKKVMMTLSEFLSDKEYFEAINTQSGSYRSAFKEAADFCGIKYPVSTHSTRKTFGYWSREIHPNDIDSLETLQNLFGHRTTLTTVKYVGLGYKRNSKYLLDMDNFMKNVSEGKEYQVKNTPVISNKTQDLMDLFLMAYEFGADGKDKADMLKTIFNLAQTAAV